MYPFSDAGNRHACKLIQTENKLEQCIELKYTIGAFSLNQWEEKLENSEINVTIL